MGLILFAFCSSSCRHGTHIYIMQSCHVHVCDDLFVLLWLSETAINAACFGKMIRVCILGEWRAEVNADNTMSRGNKRPNVVGKKLFSNAQPYNIVGLRSFIPMKYEALDRFQESGTHGGT